MTLQNRLKEDLKLAMKARNEAQKEAIRVVMGEIARSDHKELPDEEVINILKKLIKSENEMLEKSGRGATSPFIAIIESYLPALATEDEIGQWIASNIDLSAYKNKMQAMGAIMAHFGASADGNTVRQVLQKLSV